MFRLVISVPFALESAGWFSFTFMSWACLIFTSPILSWVSSLSTHSMNPVWLVGSKVFHHKIRPFSQRRTAWSQNQHIFILRTYAVCVHVKAFAAVMQSASSVCSIQMMRHTGDAGTHSHWAAPLLWLEVLAPLTHMLLSLTKASLVQSKSLACNPCLSWFFNDLWMVFEPCVQQK